MRRRNRHLKTDKSIIIWLIIMAILVVAMIIVGGATRLTDSGLSITHWSPIHGVIPPLNAAQWQEEFARYQNIPEFKYQNHDMSLEGFKFIFWWEWAHRLLGRITGLVYLFPLLFFWLKGRLRFNDAPIIFAILLLIGFQGFLGWWMVSSGLAGKRLDVEAIRLAAHLGMAFMLLGLIVSSAYSRISGEGVILRDNPLNLVLVLLFIQIIWGAMVAGSDAGLAHNDWPLIDGKILPLDYFSHKPWFANFIDNTQNIQFNHRIIAYILAIIMPIALFSRSARNIDIGYKIIVCILLALQIILGIFTLHQFGQTPPPHIYGILSGLAHQLNAAILFIMTVLAWRSFSVR